MENELLKHSWRYSFTEKQFRWGKDLQDIFPSVFCDLDDFAEHISFRDFLKWELAVLNASLGKVSRELRHHLIINNQHIEFIQTLIPVKDKGIVVGVEGRIEFIG